MEVIAALYRSVKDADRAVDALEEAGFKKDYISILARNGVINEHTVDGPRPQDVAGSAGAGALGGGLVGGLLGLLAGVGAIVIPGIGPAVAVGSLAAALGTAAGGAGVGAAVGGILGAMTRLGVSEEDAHLYAEGVKRGGVLVTVQAQEGEQAAVARTILKNSGPVDSEEIRRRWGEEGWEAFDDSQEPDPNVTVIWDRTNG